MDSVEHELLQELNRIEAWVLKCGKCEPSVEEGFERLREHLRRAVDEPQDPAEDAMHALALLEAKLRYYHGPHTSAILHEIISATTSVTRARQLMGEDR